MLAIPGLLAHAQGYDETDEIQNAFDKVETTPVAQDNRNAIPIYGVPPAGTTVVYQQVAPAKKPVSMRGRHIERVDRSELKAMFIPKGQWIFGGNIGFNEWDGSNTNFLILKDIDFKGHMFDVTPMVGYALAKNFVLGARFSYSRNYINLGNMNVQLGGIELNFDHDYLLEHTFEGGPYLRTYTPIAGSKILGMFNEIQLNYGYSKGKNTTGVVGDNFDGTFDRTHYVQLGFSPGICCFITDFAAVEVAVNVVGFKYRWTNQKTNQVETGTLKSGSANFKINLFSINIGMCIYL